MIDMQFRLTLISLRLYVRFANHESREFSLFDHVNKISMRYELPV